MPQCTCGPICQCKPCRCTDCGCADYDVVVVGAGIIGSAAAYTLVKAGQKTLLLEQFPLPHTRGSSHGASRIIRLAYPEAYLARIMPDSYRMWRKLEEESSTTLIQQTGMLAFSPDQPRIITEYLNNLNSLARANGSPPTKLLSHTDLSQRFPSLSFISNDTGCYDKDAGTLYADKSLQAYRDVFRSAGGVIRDATKVTNIIPGNIIEVVTDKGVIRTKRLVLCCGGWSAEVLGKLGLPNHYKCEAMQVCYWEPKDKSTNLIREQPCFIYAESDWECYGLPSNEYPGLTKICLHHGKSCNPDTRDVQCEEEEVHLSHLKQFIRRRLPYLNPEPVIKERCMYTLTPDENCILDTHSQYENITYGSGFSGHGFKLAPVIGVMLTDLVLKRTPTYRIKEFDADRFAKAKL